MSKFKWSSETFIQLLSCNGLASYFESFNHGFVWSTFEVEGTYQDSNSITQSELMRMMNDNSKDEEIQVGSYLSYILIESVHGPGHA